MLRRARFLLFALTKGWSRLHVVLIAASALLPLALFGIIAWQDRTLIFQDARSDVERGADSVREHALEVFQTDSLVIALIDQRIQPMSWDEMAASRPLHDYLARLVSENPELTGAIIVDPRGIVRSSSRFFPAMHLDTSSEDFFLLARASDKLVFGSAEQEEGNALLDQALGPHFHVARQRSVPSGGFNGVIVLTLSASYFPKVWLQSWHNAPDAVTDIATTPDLRMLAREPAATAGQVDPSGKFAAALRANPSEGIIHDVSTVDGVDRLAAYRRVDPFDAVVIYGLSYASIIRQWETNLLFYGGIFGLAAVALTTLAVTAVSHMNREREAVVRWRHAIEELTVETEQRSLLEKQLFRAEKMEALGQIAGGFAHDFGNILMVVHMSLERLVGSTQNETDEKMLRDTLTEVTHGMETVRSLMTFAGGGSIEAKVVDPKALIEEAAPLLHQAVGAHSVFDVAVPQELWPIRINPNQLELALLNLAVNAQHAMPNGGSLKIAARNVCLTGTPDGLRGDYVEISVSDTGLGMAPEVLIRAVEPFFTTREHDKGTGLGLSQVYGFAKQSGGTIALKSAVGVGTTVTMYIPKHSSAAVERVARAAT